MQVKEFVAKSFLTEQKGLSDVKRTNLGFVHGVRDDGCYGDAGANPQLQPLPHRPCKA
jgi:hypothetical protein